MQFKTLSAVSRFSILLPFLFAGAASPARAQAPAFANKQVEITVPWAPGGGVDILARLIAQPLSGVLNQTVIVENRPGASGAIGARYVAGRPKDGHSLLMMNDTYAITASLAQNETFNPKKDIAGVIVVAYAPQLLVTASTSPFHSLSDILKAGKAKDAKLSYGACGTGTPGNLAAESLNIKLDMKILHIPYKGCSPTIVDVVGGQLDLAWVTLGGAVPFVKSGKLRAIAVSSKDRSAILPDVPTIEESGVPGFNFSSWQAIGVPGGTPENIKTQLYAAIAKVVKTDEMQKKFLELGYTPANLNETPTIFQNVMEKDIDRFTSLVKQANLTFN